MKDIAPILIPTLNRHIHFKRCVESLAACTFADKTDLYIFLDYPSKESHWDGYDLIKSYLPSIKGFKTVNVIAREKNYGVIDNFFKSVEYVLERSDRFIFSEDDNVFSPDFLDYINKGLEVYKDRKDILSINGYQYPVTLPDSYDHDVYLFQGFSAWGYGTWKDRWGNISWDVEELKIFLNNKKKPNKLLSKNLIKGLNRIVETGYITGDTFVCYHQVRNNMYSVFPVVSHVINNGHDGSGIHGGNNKKVRKIYLNQSISDGTLKVDFPVELKPDQSVLNSLRKQFNVSIIKKAINNPDVFLKKTRNFFQRLFIPKNV